MPDDEIPGLLIICSDTGQDIGRGSKQGFETGGARAVIVDAVPIDDQRQGWMGRARAERSQKTVFQGEEWQASTLSDLARLMGGRA